MHTSALPGVFNIWNMKTIADLKQDREDILVGMRAKISTSNSKADRAKFKKTATSKVLFINSCIQFLETKPREDYLQTERVRVSKIIVRVKTLINNEKLNELTPINLLKANIETIKEDYGYLDLNRQLKSIDYLLS